MEQSIFRRQSSSSLSSQMGMVSNGRRLLVAAECGVTGGQLRRLQQTAPSPADPNSGRFPTRPGGFQSLDPNVVIIMVVLFFALICAAFVNSLMRCVLRRRAQAANARAVFSDRGDGGVAGGGVGGGDDSAEQGLDATTLASLPVLTFKPSADCKRADVDCTICLSEFKENERLRLLPKCSHVFHLDCIDMWLLSHSSCPVCRDGIKAHELALKVDHDSDSDDLLVLTLDQDGNPSVSRRSAGLSAGAGAGGAAMESSESDVNVRAELKPDKRHRASDDAAAAARLGSSRRSTSTAGSNSGSSFREGGVGMSTRLGSSRSSFRSALSAILSSGGERNFSGRWLGSSSSVLPTASPDSAAAPAPRPSSSPERPGHALSLVPASDGARSLTNSPGR